MSAKYRVVGRAECNESHQEKRGKTVGLVSLGPPYDYDHQQYQSQTDNLPSAPMSDQYTQYDNPLIGRYASPAMSELWSPQRKFSTWRRLWVALAEAEAELGLPVTRNRSPS